MKKTYLLIIFLLSVAAAIAQDGITICQTVCP